MSKFSFIWQYITNPRTTGAVAPSSKFLGAKMMHGIDFNAADCIVEYGPGTGVFTREILKNRKPSTLVLIFEMNPQFCDILQAEFSGIENFHIINDSAAKVGEYLATFGKKKACYVVSGLPFASLPTEIAENILAETKKHLKTGGAFITFQYTLLKKAFLLQYFKDIKITREFRNLPPAYVFFCL